MIIACSINQCARPAKTAGLCASHYERKRAGRADWGIAIRTRRTPGSADTPECAVERCAERQRAVGLCARHYGSRLRLESSGRPQCSVPDCGRPRRRNSLLCDAHYRRSLRGSDLNAPMRGTKSYIGEWSDWKVTAKGYVSRSRTVSGVREFQSQHRTVMAERLGRDLLAEESPHHLNGDRADNSVENLELWSSSQPPGQRVSDKVTWALLLLETYAPDKLA